MIRAYILHSRALPHPKIQNPDCPQIRNFLKEEESPCDLWSRSVYAGTLKWLIHSLKPCVQSVYEAWVDFIFGFVSCHQDFSYVFAKQISEALLVPGVSNILVSQIQWLFGFSTLEAAWPYQIFSCMLKSLTKTSEYGVFGLVVS